MSERARALTLYEIHIFSLVSSAHVFAQFSRSCANDSHKYEKKLSFISAFCGGTINNACAKLIFEWLGVCVCVCQSCQTPMMNANQLEDIFDAILLFIYVYSLFPCPVWCVINEIISVLFYPLSAVDHTFQASKKIIAANW